jgi:hypothetical protein
MHLSFLSQKSKIIIQITPTPNFLSAHNKKVFNGYRLLNFWLIFEINVDFC